MKRDGTLPQGQASMGRFVRIWLAAISVMAMLVLCFTLAVDPYGIVGTRTFAGWTDRKVAGVDWARFSKPYLLAKVAPQTLVLGSSVVDIGIDPDSAAWPASSRPVFNLGIPGASPLEQLRFLRNALTVSQPRRLFIAATFDDALWSPNRSKPGAEMAVDIFTGRLPINADGSRNTAARIGAAANLVFATFSLQAIRDSAATLVRGGTTTMNAQTTLGRNTGDTFRRWASAEGFNALFDERERSKAAYLASVRSAPRLTVEPIGEAIRLAQAHDMDVVVFIPSVRAEEVELYRQAGLDGLFARWKAQLATTVEAAAASGHTVALWDFTGSTPFTTEPVPRPGDRATAMRWFWDLIHFRPELGTLMVARMLGEGGPGDLGARVTAADMPGRAAAYAEAQRAWAAAHPADVARIADMVAGAAEAACHSALEACAASARPAATQGNGPT